MDEFQGFHRIENLIFRDSVTEPAVPYAKGLVVLWDALIAALSNPSNFNYCGCAAAAAAAAAHWTARIRPTFPDCRPHRQASCVIGHRVACSRLSPQRIPGTRGTRERVL